MSSLEALFCSVDDFCKVFILTWRNQQLPGQIKQRNRLRSLTLSEQMTIVIAFHQSHYRSFKHFYLDYVCVYWADAFPKRPSYHRFVEWMPGLIIPLCVYLKTLFGACTGISFIDATSLRVCHNRRIPSHRVFQGIAARGKTSVDWFYGFKLHLVVNDQGELLNIHVTPGNTDDRQPVPELLRSVCYARPLVYGKVFADRGYVSKPLAQELFERFNIQFFAKPRRNM
ncbi:transposase family protein [Synechococcus sp. PCC 6312]|nr:transposase family protein [Synechococcus sp. PCC 6312]